MHPSLFAPSLLAADHADLAAGMALASAAGGEWMHLDIMDGHFVPNLTFGPETVAALRRHHAGLFFDVHLMLARPDVFTEAFIKAGANLVTIHVEPDYPVAETLAAIRALGARNGIALNPGTPVESIEPFLAEVDLVLAMTVQPGFGGQGFRHDVLPKIRQIAQWRRERGLDFRIETDGGITLDTARLCREAGCDTFVAGTAFFRSDNPAAFAATIRNL